MVFRSSFALAAVLLLAGCDAMDSMTEGFSHAEAVSTKLQISTGLKSLVGFNWNNGLLTSVTVNFEGLPEKTSLQEIAAASKNAVLSEFKQAPKVIVLSFSIEP